jgi:glucose-6-phosphate isomerase
LRFSVSLADLGQPDVGTISELLSDVRKGETPQFARYVPELGPITKAAEEVGEVEHLIVVGNGGSVTTLKGLSWLAPGWEGRLHIIDTLDPSYIDRVRSSVQARKALVVAVSKSGRNMNLLEALTAFRGHPTLAITARPRSPLGMLAKANGWKVVDVPDGISGRFSGRTASALLPAAIMGLDIKAISSGMGEAYDAAASGKELLELSGGLYLKERLGSRALFVPVYSRAHSYFCPLVTQLLHETLSKERKGLTALCFEGPEVQHHTNQRVFDGPEDVMTLFITRKDEDGPMVRWEGAEGDVMLGERALSEIGGYTLGSALRYEYEGVMGHMRSEKMPFAHVQLEGESSKDIGFYVGMWHYLAYYFAVLRRVDPFDQPAVEKAKEISMGLRLER